MSAGTTCELCYREMGDDAYACTGCSMALVDALRIVIDGLDTDLTDALAKQTAFSTGHSGNKPTKASAAPMPIDPRISESASVLRNTMTTWVRLIHGDLGRGELPADTLPAMARWLTPLAGWIRHAAYAAELIDEVVAAIKQAQRAIDLPIRRVPLHVECGEITLVEETPVPCGGALHVVLAPGLAMDKQVRCDVDPHHWTTVERMELQRRRAGRVWRHLTNRGTLAS